MAVYIDQGVVLVKDDKKLADWRLDVFDFEDFQAQGLEPDRWWEGQRINFKNGEVRIGRDD